MRAIRTGVIVLAVTLAVYAVVDLGFGLFQGYENHLFPPDPNLVPGHRGEPYATSQFIIEGLELGGIMTIPGTNLLEPQEVHGRYYNVDPLPPTGLNYRRTLNPAADNRPTVTVLFIGGSNVYGAEVPDDMTIPSQLSVRLNQLDSAHRYEVINAGVTGADSALEKGRLAYELAHGRKPDIVLVMDGGLDVMEGIYLGMPRRPQAAGRSQPVEWFYRYVPLNIYRALRAWGAAHAVEMGLKHPPAQLQDPARLRRLTDATMAYYLDNQKGLAALAKDAQARFISIVEPNRYASDFKTKTEDLVYVDRDMAAHMPGLKESLPGFLKMLSAAHATLAGSGIETLDLSAVFQDKTDNIFTTSPGHFNGTGSRIVAERIAEAILHPQAASQP
jgi:lysophospholipase L1-like esterase